MENGFRQDLELASFWSRIEPPARDRPAAIISSLLVDLGKFMTVLFLFLIGFSMLVTAMNTPFYQLDLEVRTTELFLLYPLIQDGIGEEVAVPINCPTYPTATETTGWSKLTRGCRVSSDENIAMI